MTIADRTLLDMFETMTRIRLFEERVTLEYQRGDMPGFVHTYIGAEAVAAGVCAHLTDRDLIASTHRGHGHSLAKGCSIAGMLAELYGRETGLCKGRGGSMHIADFEIGMLGANAIVGGSIGLAFDENGLSTIEPCLDGGLTFSNITVGDDLKTVVNAVPASICTEFDLQPGR